jgi:hypothetical protein
MRAHPVWRRTCVFSIAILAAVAARVPAQQAGATPAQPYYGLTISPPRLDPLPRTPTSFDKRAVKLSERLRQTVDFDGFDDPKLTLQEALDSLAKVYALKFLVNEQAFKLDQINDVPSLPVAEKPLPKARNIKLETVLRRLLARIPSVSGAMWRLQGDTVEITNGIALCKELGLPEESPIPALVHLDLDRVPLETAVRMIADSVGINIVLDVGVGDKTKFPISATITNVPADTAVRLFANMANLRVVVVENVLYVTTSKKGRMLEKEQRLLLTPNDIAGMHDKK